MKDKQQTFGKGLAEALAVGKANRIAEVQKRLAPKAQWTQSPPTKAGRWWWCETRESIPEMNAIPGPGMGSGDWPGGWGWALEKAAEKGGWWAPVIAPAPPGKEAKDV